MKTALLLIATGERYWRYINPLIESAKKYLFPHDVILWTDSTEHHLDFHIHKTAQGYPHETLYRYHTFLQEKTLLSRYDFLMYCDVDMEFVAPIKEEDIFSDGITACLHPGYVGRVGTPERRPESRAYIPEHANNKYFAGGFNGGTAKHFLWMAEHIKTHIDEDTKNGITAIWHDESFLNAFLYYNNPPARILGPEYCYPEGCNGRYAGTEIGEPKIIALTKT